MIKINRIGQKYGKLLVLELSHKEESVYYWKCKCDCGNECIVDGHAMQSKNTLSCGCIRKNILRKRNFRHGKCDTKAYQIWCGMKTRCYNKNDEFYEYYGGKGIKLSNEWLDFNIFFNDMGNPPKGLSIERKDNNKNYCKENCKWATQKEQANNRSNNKIIKYNGKSQTLSQWSNELNIKYSILLDRLNQGWTIEKTFTKKCKKVPKYIEYDNKKLTIKEWSIITQLPIYVIEGRLKRKWNIEKTFYQTYKPYKV